MKRLLCVWCGTLVMLAHPKIGHTQHAVVPSSAKPGQRMAPTPPVIPARAVKHSGWLGLVVQFDNDGMAVSTYPVVISVEWGSPAQQAGFAAGDTIVGYDHIDARSDPVGVLRLLTPNRRIVIRYRRNGLHTVPVVVTKRKNGAPSVSVTYTSNGDDMAGPPVPQLLIPPTVPVAILAPLEDRGGIPLAGANVTRMNAGLAAALGVPNAGVLVIDMMPETPAERAGIQSGDVITAVAGTRVTDASSIMHAMFVKTAHQDRSIVVDVLRKGKPKKLTLRW